MVYTTIYQGWKELELQVNHCGQKMTFLSEIPDMGQMLQENWLSGFCGEISFPLFEGVTFHFGKGRIYLFLQNSQGKKIYLRDATEKYSRWESSLIFQILSGDRRLWNLLISKMEPAIANAMTGYGPELLPAVTRFPGFSRDFYDVIPYGKNEKIPHSFQTAAKGLHTPKKAKEFYLSSNLPKCKSIRREFFRRPQLMFYMQEHETMWGILEDINLYRTFLESESLFEVLASLHQRPMLETFFQDYSHVCGAKALVEKMRNGWKPLSSIGIDYCSLGKDERKSAQKRWSRTKILMTSWRGHPEFSVPMARAEGVPERYTIDGFTFSRLRTSREYDKTGQKMMNCLSAWRPSDNPVFGVYSRNGAAVAAVEVEGNTVVQVRGRENKSIFLCPGLFEAYRQWVSAVKLEEDYGLAFDGFDDELPF